jgi:hypothetical protein
MRKAGRRKARFLFYHMPQSSNKLPSVSRATKPPRRTMSIYYNGMIKIVVTLVILPKEQLSEFSGFIKICKKGFIHCPVKQKAKVAHLTLALA